MRRFRVTHETVYRYRSPVAFGEHRMMLRPRDSFNQRVAAFSLEIVPQPVTMAWSEDPSGNLAGTVTFGKRSRELRIVALATVEVDALEGGYEPVLAAHARTCPFSYGAEEMPDLARFTERQHPDPEHIVDRWTQKLQAETPGRNTWAFLLRLHETIRRDFAYRRREEPGVQSPADTLRRRGGSCRDFAVLMCEAVRTQGLAARFVSGYLHVRSGDDRARRAGGATHAWLQVYLPGGGWIDFDPTSGAIGNADLIRVATVRDPLQASPLTGSFLGFPSDYLGMEVNVDVIAEADIGRSSVAA